MAHTHPDTDSHSHAHGHHHGHSHDPASPHPAQAASWSILRMPLLTRVGAAVAVSAGLWVMVLTAMR